VLYRLHSSKHICASLWRWWDRREKAQAIFSLIRQYYLLDGPPTFSATSPIFTTWSRQSGSNEEETIGLQECSGGVDGDNSTNSESLFQGPLALSGSVLSGNSSAVVTSDDVPQPFFHAQAPDSGLGIPELQVQIQLMRRARVEKLVDRATWHSDSVLLYPTCDGSNRPRAVDGDRLVSILRWLWFCRLKPGPILSIDG